MTIAELIFWASLLLIVYTYVGYPLVLFLAYVAVQIRSDLRYLRTSQDRRVVALPDEALPTVSLIVPAYNEEACLAEKIANIGQMDYPPEKMEVVFVSDGSTDGTNDILRGLDDPRFHVVLLPNRSGKANALNEAAARARHDILLFSDASTLYAPDAVRKLVRHFANPRMGVVCGAVRLLGSAESQQTEGLYWQYESMIRFMESRLGANLAASGAIYALRRSCYRPLPPHTILDDFVIPMTARKLGFLSHCDPEAVATEFSAATVRHEFTRRVRIALGSFRALGELARVPLPAAALLALFSHKFLRWMLPFLFLGALASSALLWDNLFYRVAFLAQLLFYLWAGLGFLFRHRLQGVRFALAGYFLLAMNVAFLVGFVRFLAGRKEATWQRVS